MCFTTRFPVLVTWGPELTMIYNDGYRDMLGSEKHPGAMGSPLAEVWKDVWDDIRPSVERVMRDGEPTWRVDQHLVTRRSGYEEDVFFTYSYSPLRDSADVVRGLLDIATETTGQVVERRRMRLLGDLSARLTTTRDDLAAIARESVDLLAGSDDVAAAELFLRGSGGALAPLVATGARGPGVAADQLARVAASGVAEERGRTLVAPLTGPGDVAPCGAVALTAAGRRPWDAGYAAFLHLVASTVGAAVSGALRHRREVDTLRTVSDTLQAAILPAVATEPGIAARYRPASGELAVGGDWYDVVGLGPGRRAVVVGDCVGHGLDAAARMGQLRAATRALLLDSPSPAAVLDGLERFARTLPGADCTTVFCAVADEQERTLTYAVAGHLPPVLRRADGSVELLDRARGAALAVGSARRTEAVEPLGDGDLVVVYTDGLVERRGEGLPRGIERLRAAVAAQPVGARTSAVADDLLRTLAPPRAEDDVALVVYRAGAR